MSKVTLFINFLKENNAYFAFRIEISRYSKNKIEDFIFPPFLEDEITISTISSYFLWDGSLLGYRYWRRLATEWAELFRKTYNM